LKLFTEQQSGRGVVYLTVECESKRGYLQNA
jgi:hypothetical protein